MIYADYNGSAPLSPAVREHLLKRIPDGPYANPNAIHSLGKKMSMGIEKCRRLCAKVLGAKGSQVFFNSGASEGISHVFFHLLSDPETLKNKPVVITSEIEHAAVIKACAYYESLGYQIKTIKTKVNGEIDLSHLKELIESNKDQIAFVTVMAANNETGVIQPWKEVSKLCHENQIIFFSDTTQYIGKTDFNFADSGMDFAVMSGHKVGAMVGCGILLVKDPTTLKSYIFGGGQERGTRGGTQNYLGIETLAVALEDFSGKKAHLEELKKARLQFERELKDEFSGVEIVGADADRLATSTLIAYPGIHGQAVQIELESQDIFVTTSSACSDNNPETSRVLKAMGIDDQIGRGVVRISLCCGSSANDYNRIKAALSSIYKKLAKISSY